MSNVRHQLYLVKYLSDKQNVFFYHLISVYVGWEARVTGRTKKHPVQVRSPLIICKILFLLDLYSNLRITETLYFIFIILLPSSGHSQELQLHAYSTDKDDIHIGIQC